MRSPKRRPASLPHLAQFFFTFRNPMTRIPSWVRAKQGCSIETEWRDTMKALGKFLTAAAAVTLMASSSVIADGIQVGGHLVNVTVAEQATNMALGSNAKATQSIGAISGNVRVNGNLTNITVVGEAVNLAMGAGTEAGMSVNSIQGDVLIRGGTKRTVFVKRILNVASGPGTHACVSVGTHGNGC